MFYIIAILTAMVSYFIGSINPAIILSKAIYGEDIRLSGSGNAGSTNMLRTHGKGIAVLTLICDILKGSVAVVFAMWLDIFLASSKMNLSPFEQTYLFGNLKYIAGIFVVVGHDFPIFFGFKGGKGVATSLGVIMILNWKIGLIILAAALIVMIVSRYVSLGSISAAAIYPFVLFTYIIASGEKPENSLGYLVMAFVIALLVILKHHANITRLKNGTESKLFSRKKKENIEADEEEETV